MFSKDDNYLVKLSRIRTTCIEQFLAVQLPPITKAVQIRRTRHAGHNWRSKDELINEILLWTPSHRRAKLGQLVRINIQRLFTNTGSSLEDLPSPIDNRDEWRERVRKVHVYSTTWWWWRWGYRIHQVQKIKNKMRWGSLKMLSTKCINKLYICNIYCHPQTDCSVVWQLFSVARHVGRLKLGSKPAHLYVRLSIIPLGQQA